MNIEYKNTKMFKPEELVKLFTSVGWFEESAKYPNRLKGGNRFC